MEVILYIILLVVIAGLTMVATNILYDIFAVVIPIIAVAVIAVGVVFGFGVAVKNTVGAYRAVYGQRGGRTR